jgi:membrane protein
MAAAISFYTLFSMFPLGLAVISVMGFIIGPNASTSDIANELAEVLPVSTHLVGSTMEGIAKARTITGLTSFLGLIWASSAAFAGVRKGINAAWGITTPRPFLRERLIDIGLVFVAGIIVLIILFTAPIIGVAQEIANSYETEIQARILLSLITNLISPAVTFIAILLLYKTMPYTKVKMIFVAPGALVASICFTTVQMGFVWYVSKYSVYNIVYGSIGALIALLSWIYISAIILLFGAHLTSAFHTFCEQKELDLKITAWINNKINR